jgi:MFS family permease
VLLVAGVMAGGIRWLACGLSSDLRAIYAAQLLHGVTVAGVGVGSALYIDACVPERHRSTGQGLGAVAGPGFGAIVSNVVAGWLMDHASAGAPFVIGGAGSLLLVLMVPVILPPPRRPEPAPLITTG